mmetsp:Transcript_20121/g.43788  ORF Transcript_20121/g.43788 Transcript_20121/m.43788 type:complete len:103 (-) Transcript_20121:560-868(-)
MHIMICNPIATIKVQVDWYGVQHEKKNTCANAIKNRLTHSFHGSKWSKQVNYSSFLVPKSATLSTSSEAVVSADFFASAIAVSIRDIGSAELFFKKSFRKLS